MPKLRIILKKLFRTLLYFTQAALELVGTIALFHISKYLSLYSILDAHLSYSCANVMCNMIHILHSGIWALEAITAEEKRNSITVTDKSDFLPF